MEDLFGNFVDSTANTWMQSTSNNVNYNNGGYNGDWRDEFMPLNNMNGNENGNGNGNGNYNGSFNGVRTLDQATNEQSSSTSTPQLTELNVVLEENLGLNSNSSLGLSHDDPGLSPDLESISDLITFGGGAPNPCGTDSEPMETDFSEVDVSREILEELNKETDKNTQAAQTIPTSSPDINELRGQRSMRRRRNARTTSCGSDAATSDSDESIEGAGSDSEADSDFGGGDPTPNVPKAKITLWMTRLLESPAHNPRVVKWEDKSEGTFRIVDQRELSRLWGVAKRNPGMDYDKFSRAMRYYYKRGELVIVRKKLIYQFGPNSPLFTGKM